MPSAKTRAVALWCSILLLGCGPSEIEKELVRDLDRAQEKAVERAASGSVDNGFACLASLRDVSAKSLADFLEPNDGNENTRGLRLKLEQELLASGSTQPEVRAHRLALEPWAARVRACADSKRLVFVPGMNPWTVRSGDAAAIESLVALVGYTGLEVHDLLEKKQVSLASERCLSTAAVWLDAARIDAVHLSVAHRGMVILAPLCVRAMDLSSEQEKERLAASWTALQARAPTLAEVLENIRLGAAVNAFGSKLSRATRERLQVPDASGDGSSSYWKKWNADYKAIIAASTDLDRSRTMADALWEFELTDAPPRGMSGLSSIVLDQHHDVTNLVRVLADLGHGVAVPRGTKVDRGVLHYVSETGGVSLRHPEQPE